MTGAVNIYATAKPSRDWRGLQPMSKQHRDFWKRLREQRKQGSQQ
jgi:hypothetical protein